MNNLEKGLFSVKCKCLKKSLSCTKNRADVSEAKRTDFVTHQCDCADRTTSHFGTSRASCSCSVNLSHQHPLNINRTTPHIHIHHSCLIREVLDRLTSGKLRHANVRVLVEGMEVEGNAAWCSQEEVAGGFFFTWDEIWPLTRYKKHFEHTEELHFVSSCKGELLNYAIFELNAKGIAC